MREKQIEVRLSWSFKCVYIEIDGNKREETKYKNYPNIESEPHKLFDMIYEYVTYELLEIIDVEIIKDNFEDGRPCTPNLLLLVDIKFLD